MSDTTPSIAKRPTKTKRARLHFPAMNADEALLVVAILEKAATMIWRAHGDAMVDRLAAAGVETPRPIAARWEGNRQAADDYDF